MSIEQGKGNAMSLLSGAFLANLATGSVNDAWVQAMGYEPIYKSETHAAFGFSNPVLVEDSYGGCKGSFDILSNGSNIVEACLTQQDLATAEGFDPAKYNEFFIFANIKDLKTGTLFRSHFIRQCKVVGNPYASSVDGKTTLKFDFEGTGVIKFKRPMYIEQFAGSGTPGQAVVYTKTALAYDTNYAQLVLLSDDAAGSGNRILSKTATEYAEIDGTGCTIDSSITVPVTDKITVAYIYDPAV